MPNKSTLALFAAFALGCAAARTFVDQPANAQATQRWEHICFLEDDEDEVTAKANEAGAAGWEMAGTGSYPGTTIWCFKRAK